MLKCSVTSPTSLSLEKLDSRKHAYRMESQQDGLSARHSTRDDSYAELQMRKNSQRGYGLGRVGLY